MPTDILDHDGLAKQIRLVLVEIGRSGSGYERFGAAMYLHRAGQISSELLEIYRRCCKLDAENPLELADIEGITVPDLLRQQT